VTLTLIIVTTSGHSRPNQCLVEPEERRVELAAKSSGTVTSKAEKNTIAPTAMRLPVRRVATRHPRVS